MRRASIAAALGLAASLVAACATPFPHYAEVEPRTDAEPRDGAEPRTTGAPHFPAQPEGTEATLRAILTIAGMELPLTLRVWRKYPGALRLIAVGDLGGTQFHVVVLGGAVETVQRHAMLPAPVLVDGIAADLARCLLGARRETDRLVRGPGGARAFLRERGADKALFWSARTDGVVDHIAAGSGNALHSTTILSWRDGRPADITIRNERFDYTLELETHTWHPAILSPATFRTNRQSSDRRSTDR